ncbi:protein DDI1 homolog 2-like [Adelges cooleyi]|uniref:protein DDI1 homolog 2-like n=1 Tax=Adelges cooleyi TaxID=133065 RepID=UPI0021805E1E|nr:protein DDI1 homolog 2-like [Adelges cooleyi]
MRITVLLAENGRQFTVDVGSKNHLKDLKAKCASLSGVPTDRIHLAHRGNPLTDLKATVGKLIRNGGVVDMTVLRAGTSDDKTVECIIPHFGRSGNKQVPHKGANIRPNASSQIMYEDAKYIRRLLIANPDQLALMGQNNRRLADAMATGSVGEFAKVMMSQLTERKKKSELLEKLATSKAFDAKSQKRIAKEILNANIDSNLEAALEYNPELFGSVFMLYIDCKVNGYPVKAFVDSGAQTTIITVNCAKKCDIMRLVDTRWAGIAKGVGVQKIVGRAHLVSLQIENDFLTTSFSVLDGQPMDMLLGLDLLRRYQCAIDLANNVLIIGTTGTKTPFLPERKAPGNKKRSNKRNLYNCEQNELNFRGDDVMSLSS